jgi:hypothetical protein
LRFGTDVRVKPAVVLRSAIRVILANLDLTLYNVDQKMEWALPGLNARFNNNPD